MLRVVLATSALLLLAGAAWLGAQDPATPPQGRFGLSRIATASGRAENLFDFFANDDCALCHRRQWEEMKGSMHSVAHADPLYRSFAELARREAGEEVYTYCSGCHSPAGVVSEMIPAVKEEQLPALAKAGVTCDICHQISALTGAEGPWGEPGNASIVLEPGSYRKFGPIDVIEHNPAHEGVQRDFFTKSEYCASCHTIIHPINGLRIEHTYDEWKNSVYAENGIQCQDCHMRSVEDAIEVARTLAPVEKPEEVWARMGGPRPTSRHYFVGGNVDADLLADGPRHAAMAEQRLQSAATLEVRAPASAAPGSTLSFDVVITNTGAGHNLPTSLTELREMWVHLRVTDAAGAVLHESGHLDEQGDIHDGAIRFGAHTVDAAGEITYKPWEAVGFGWKRLIPPKESALDKVELTIPAGAPGPLTIEARLQYRIAPPKVVAMVMGDAAFVPKIVEMAAARAEVPTQ